MAAGVTDLKSATTLLGKDVVVKVDMGKVYINDAQVIITDIETSNGVIHVVDTVILPPAEVGTIVDTAVADGRIKTKGAKGYAIVLDGTVLESAGDDWFYVKLENGKTVRVPIAPKKSLLRILSGDKVQVSFYKSDLKQGIITKTYNDAFLK